jgi:hypothetical protein
MNEANQSIGPPCEKCQIPMTFHSVQEVNTRAGHELIQVYECEKCHQLAAFHGLAAAAND